jgi:hypothetical protein
MGQIECHDNDYNGCSVSYCLAPDSNCTQTYDSNGCSVVAPITCLPGENMCHNGWGGHMMVSIGQEELVSCSSNYSTR